MLSPAQVADYEVEAPLGQGTTGLVFRARDRRNGQPVAVKLLRPEAEAEPERRSRFLREARAIAALDHPHIAKIYEVGVACLGKNDALALNLPEDPTGEPHKLPFLALELLDGQDLGVMIGGKPLPLELACDLAAQMLSALAAAHRVGIVHRDLKPANVRITSEKQVKLLDFGLAKIAPGGAIDPATGSQLTLDGMVMGTLPYLAPEQLQGDVVDGRADLFSFGVLFFEMLTGKPPFTANTLVEYARCLIHSRIEKPSRLLPGLPPFLDALVLELVAIEPGERPRTAEIALERLSRGRLAPSLQHSGPERSKNELAGEIPLQPAPRTWPSWLVLGVPLLLALLLVLFLLHQV